MQIDHYKDFTILDRMMGIVSSAIKITGASSYHLLGTINFSSFIYLYIWGYKINKIIKLLNKIISTESYTRNMDLKILPEARYVLKIIRKHYQALTLPDKLIMHLTLHEQTY